MWAGEAIFAQLPAACGDVMRSVGLRGSDNFLAAWNARAEDCVCRFKLRGRRRAAAAAPKAILSAFGPPGAPLAFCQELRDYAVARFGTAAGLPLVLRVPVYEIAGGLLQPRSGLPMVVLPDQGPGGGAGPEADAVSDASDAEMDTMPEELRRQRAAAAAPGPLAPGVAAAPPGLPLPLEPAFAGHQTAELSALRELLRQAEEQLQAPRSSSRQSAGGVFVCQRQRSVSFGGRAPVTDCCGELTLLAPMSTQAALWAPDATMDKDFWRRELQVAAYAGVQTVEYGLPGPLVLVTTCLRRETSLLTSLAINGATLFRFRSWLRFAVMSFGDDVALLHELRARFQPLLSCGMLLLASGGTAGLNYVQLTVRAPEAPAWMPLSPGIPSMEVAPRPKSRRRTPMATGAEPLAGRWRAPRRETHRNSQPSLR